MGTKKLEKKSTKENQRKEYEKLGLKKKPAKSNFMKVRKTEFQKEMRSLCQVFPKDQMNKGSHKYVCDRSFREI